MEKNYFEVCENVDRGLRKAHFCPKCRHSVPISNKNTICKHDKDL